MVVPVIGLANVTPTVIGCLADRDLRLLDQLRVRGHETEWNQRGRVTRRGVMEKHASEARRYQQYLDPSAGEFALMEM